MRQCVLCGEELHSGEYRICSLCDPNGNLNYFGVTHAEKTKESLRKQKWERFEREDKESES